MGLTVRALRGNGTQETDTKPPDLHLEQIGRVASEEKKFFPPSSRAGAGLERSGFAVRRVPLIFAWK